MSEDVCRYCLEINNDTSITPCNCTSRVHNSCLLEWINKRQININNNLEEFKKRLTTCEICKEQFQLSYDIENRISENRISEMRNNQTTLKCYHLLPYLFLFLFLFFLFLLTGEFRLHSHNYHSYNNNSTNFTLQEFNTIRILKNNSVSIELDDTFFISFKTNP